MNGFISLLQLVIFAALVALIGVPAIAQVPVGVPSAP